MSVVCTLVRRMYSCSSGRPGMGLTRPGGTGPVSQAIAGPTFRPSTNYLCSLLRRSCVPDISYTTHVRLGRYGRTNQKLLPPVLLAHFSGDWHNVVQVLTIFHLLRTMSLACSRSSFFPFSFAILRQSQVTLLTSVAWFHVQSSSIA